MYKYYLKYFIGFFIAIGLIIVLIILLFGGGDDKGSKSNEQTSEVPTSLVDLANTGGEVRMTIKGNVRANQDYYEIQISSNPNSNQVNIVQGYEGRVINSKSFGNNKSAYETFLKALQYAGFEQGKKDSKTSDDRGYCPLGQRYIYEIIQDGKTTQRFWGSTCGKDVPSTYLGSIGLTNDLFQQQIPDYDEITSDVDF